MSGRRPTDAKETGGEKADVDYIYDIPAELAKDLTGFRHDEDIPGMAGEIFHVFESAKNADDKPSSWNPFKKIFGGKRN